MKTRTLSTTLAGLALVAAFALTGCTSPPGGSGEPSANGPGSDAAAAFLACLTSSKVEAKINTTGQVLVKLPTQPGGDGSDFSVGTGDEFALGMEGDAAGNLWVAAAGASYFVDDPETQDAYAACERQHPEFTQPQFDPNSDPRFEEMMVEQQEAALAFARCAREHGFAQIADPDGGDLGGAIMIPEDFTEQDFRVLAEACYDPESGFAFGTSEDAAFQPWTILEEFHSAPLS